MTRRTFDDIRDDANRAEFEASNRAPLDAPYVSLLSRAEKLKIARRLRDVLTHNQSSGNPRQWAINLREREESGEILTLYQRDAWREALAGAVQPDEPPPDERRLAELKRATDRRVRQYIEEKALPVDLDDVPW